VIVGIGCDLTEIYRVKKALTIEKFAARVLLNKNIVKPVACRNLQVTRQGLRLKKLC
jgi:phosphopantetheinyl transferase (holo-ACP synthase)